MCKSVCAKSETHRRCSGASKTFKRMIVYLLNRAGKSAGAFFAKPIVSLTRRCFWLKQWFYRFCLFVSSVSYTV
jgi:hypothetical protein